VSEQIDLRITDPRDILLAPVVSEKSYTRIDENKYTFLVSPSANKTQIKIAIEKVFGVQVEKVNTIRTLGKMKRQGTTQGRRPSEKKAIVTLKDSSKAIEFFESMAQ